MTVAEKISRHVVTLPERLQAEVLVFVEFMETKSLGVDREVQEWSAASLSSAMRGMESEPDLYSEDDLKEAFI